MIVILLESGPVRFMDLQRGLGGISKKVLADTLRALERDGLIDRAVEEGGAGGYRLTPLGATLHAPLLALQVWAEEHVDDVLLAQDRYDDARDCSSAPSSSAS